MHYTGYESPYKIHRPDRPKLNMPRYCALHVVWEYAGLIRTEKQADLRIGTQTRKTRRMVGNGQERGEGQEITKTRCCGRGNAGFE